MDQIDPHQLMSVKQLAGTIGRGRTYVHSVKTAMKRQGIEWPQGLITKDIFMRWVWANRHRCTEYANKKQASLAKRDCKGSLYGSRQTLNTKLNIIERALTM